MLNPIVATIIGLVAALLVGGLVIDDGPGLGPQAVILGISGGMIGWLAAKSECGRRR